VANTKVQSEQIEDGSITADKLADGTIVAAELADNAVTTAKINADAVTGAKIADDAIDSEHYTDGSIDTAHIADAQITVAKMAANSVDSDQYVDGSIDTVHLADLQVTTAKIANGNISTAKIADNAVTSAKIDTNIDIAGTFDVTGATTLDSTLSVAGISTLNVSAVIKSAGTNDTPADLSFWHTDASIVSGDDIAVISAEGSDSGGSPPYQGAKITFDADANWDTGTSNYYPTNINFFTQDNSGTDTIAAGSRLTIKSDGKVGIGTTSPNRLVTVYKASAPVLNIKNSDADLHLEQNGQNSYVGNSSTSGFLQLFTNNGNSTVNILANGNVGIGTASPANILHTSGTGVQRIQIDATDNNAAGAGLYMKVFNSGSLVGNATVRVDNAGNIDFFNGTSSESKKMVLQADGKLAVTEIRHISAGNLEIGNDDEKHIMHSDGYHQFQVADTEIIRINGEGIAFNGDSAAANSLDDYEEGTWTPAVASDASASAYNYRNGYYTKIGRQVRVTCQFRISTIGSFTGATINLQGLPYNIGNHSNYDPIGVIMIKSAATAKNDIYVRGVSNSNYVRIESNNGNTSSDRNCNANMFDTDTICFMDFTYFVA